MSINFLEKMDQDCLKAIRILKEKNYTITVKKIRHELNIAKDDRSKISRIWRSLIRLENKGLIKRIENRGYGKTHRYILMSVSLKVCETCGYFIKRNIPIKHINKARKEIHYFCSKKCKDKWIYEQLGD